MTWYQILKRDVRNLVCRFRTWQLRMFPQLVARPGVLVWCDDGILLPGEILELIHGMDGEYNDRLMVSVLTYRESPVGTFKRTSMFELEKLSWRLE